MLLSVKNVEQYFNVLNARETFDLLLLIDFTEEEIELFDGNEDIEISIETAKRLDIYRGINSEILQVTSFYKSLLNIDVEYEEMIEFNNSIKEVYKYIDHIFKCFAEVNSNFAEKNPSKDTKARIEKTKSKRTALARNIRNEDTNFINRIIDFGMMKTQVKKHLSCDVENILLKDLAVRYFKLISMGVLDE
jgi:hypothetical protein